MSQNNIPPLPDHQDCEILTGLTAENIPRDGSLGSERGYRKAAASGNPMTARTAFFLRGGQIAIVSSDRDESVIVLGVSAMSRSHATVTMGKLRRRGLLIYERGKPLTIDTEALSIYLTGISPA